MTKFSDFIRNPGTAGPPTVQGIYDLGFALRSEWPGVLAKYVRVDAAQTFTDPEKTQGRANIGAVIGVDVQAYSASLTSLAGLTTAADQLAYTTATNTWAVTTLTAFARTILDDTNAAGVRTTIGLGNVDNTSDANKPVSTATQTALDLKANLASPTFTGVPAVPTAAPGTNTTQAASTAFVTAAVTAAGVFTKSYTSPEQTITSGGQLVLNHLMALYPKVINLTLVCKTAEGGYSINDEVEVYSMSDNGANVLGCNIRKDATTLTLRFSAAANAYVISRADTGARIALTNANWRLVVRAFA